MWFGSIPDAPANSGMAERFRLANPMDCGTARPIFRRKRSGLMAGLITLQTLLSGASLFVVLALLAG